MGAPTIQKGNLGRMFGIRDTFYREQVAGRADEAKEMLLDRLWQRCRYVHEADVIWSLEFVDQQRVILEARVTQLPTYRARIAFWMLYAAMWGIVWLYPADAAYVKSELLGHFLDLYRRADYPKRSRHARALRQCLLTLGQLFGLWLLRFVRAVRVSHGL